MADKGQTVKRIAPYGLGFLIETLFLFFFSISVANKELMSSSLIALLVPVIALFVMMVFAVLKRILKHRGTEVHKWPVIVGALLTIGCLCFFYKYFAQSSYPMDVTAISGSLFGVGLGILTAYWVHVMELMPTDETIKYSLIALIGSIVLAVLIIVFIRSTGTLLAIAAASTAISMVLLLFIDFKEQYE